MPAKGILHTIEALHMPTVEPPLGTMAATWEPDSRKQTKLQVPTYNMLKDSEKRNSSEEVPWLNCNMPEKASGTEVVPAAAHW